MFNFGNPTGPAQWVQTPFGPASVQPLENGFFAIERNGQRTVTNDPNATLNEVPAAHHRDDFGPLRYDQLSAFFTQEHQLADAPSPRDRLNMLNHFGYRDEAHRQYVRNTFVKYYGHGNPNEGLTWWSWKPDAEQLYQELALTHRARQRQAQVQNVVQGNPDMLPVEGVSIELYAHIAAQQAQAPTQQAFAALLAQHGMDFAKFDRVSSEWMARMGRDATASIATIYGQAFSGAGAGQFGAAAQAGNAAMQNVPMGQVMQGAAGPPPVSFERYCEIGGAQAAWSASGLDVNAMLKQSFNMTALDWSNLSAYWMSKMMSDMSLGAKYGQLMSHYQTQYASPNPDADVSF